MHIETFSTHLKKCSGFNLSKALSTAFEFVRVKVHVNIFCDCSSSRFQQFIDLKNK